MIDFPASPTVGQKFTAVGISWTWDGTKWSGSAGSGAKASCSDTPPVNPALGTLWWDSVGGQLYIYYNDGNSSQWVIAVNYGFGLFLPIAGGTLTGPLTLSGNPVAPLQPTTKQYVDALPVAINHNRIINGDMLINQRGVATGATSVYTVDRWQYACSQAAKGNWSQNDNGVGQPGGYKYSLGFASSSAYASIASDYFEFYQTIEADMITDFQWGTTNAIPVTLSFWFYASQVGTYSGSVRNAANNRSYPFNITYPALTWTKIVINIPGDTGGTWVMSGNAASITLTFDLGSGSNYRSAAGSWQAGNYVGATGAVSPVGVNGLSLFITGVKLEGGNVATPFPRETLAKKLLDCQRYFYKPLNSIFGSSYSPGASGSLSIFALRVFPVTMRAAPTQSGAAFSNANLNAPSITSMNIDGATWVATNAAAGGFQIGVQGGTETYSAEL